MVKIRNPASIKKTFYVIVNQDFIVQLRLVVNAPNLSSCQLILYHLVATFKLLLLYVVELRKAYEYVRLHNVFITSDYILYFVTYCTFLYYFLQSKTSKLLQLYGVFFLILFKSLTNLTSIKSLENKIGEGDGKYQIQTH